MQETELTLEIPLKEDYSHSAEVLRQYSDANLDFADALIVAMAERLNITRLLTLHVGEFGNAGFWGRQSCSGGVRKMNEISHLGTFDVENYGDLLYPLIFCHLLETRDSSMRVRQYSLLPGAAPLGAGFKTHAIRELFDEVGTEPRRLVIGGGDILRTDWDNVAMHYGRQSRVSYNGLRHSIGTAGLFGYFVRQNLPRQNAGRFYAQRFRACWMDYLAAGPFLINHEDLPGSGVIHYISCGVPHDFAPSERDLVKRTLDRAQSIYLRDEQSAEKLRRAGVRREINVAPDLAVTLSDQFDHATESRKGRQIFSQMGVSGKRPVLCFQSQPYPGFIDDEIIEQLKRYRERAGADVVLLPTGHCHGDHEFLLSLSIRSGGALKYIAVNSFFDIISVIAASAVFVGTSLHGNITAFSFGIPHLFGPLPVDKANGFLNVTNLPLELKLRSWSEINEKIDMATGLGPAFFLRRAQEAKSQVRYMVDEMFGDLLKNRLPVSAAASDGHPA